MWNRGGGFLSSFLPIHSLQKTNFWLKNTHKCPAKPRIFQHKMVSDSLYKHGHITEELYARIPTLWVSRLWITNFPPQSGFNFAVIRNFSPTPATDPNSCTQYVKRIKPNSKRWITTMTLLNSTKTKQLCGMHKVHKQCIMRKVCDVVCCSLWQLLITAKTMSAITLVVQTPCLRQNLFTNNLFLVTFKINNSLLSLLTQQ